ncbi:hypothetical protein KVR01_003277 [Diaporthe batatas]|uniref:uncharacterized protein n=1 Tax=Diaporthe batatas TaxID=748121 RepID=UPI001D03F6FD|nr:uncharacterized protein KVR01_003277 [Diaporthe batatas]KAG8167588.1 hypothetical protein KVR01_003277 [Diaporthe batatas]
MQTESTKSIDQEPSNSATTSQKTTTQDGFRSPEPGSLDGGSRSGLDGVSSGRASPVLRAAQSVEAGAEEEPSSGTYESHYTLPGERVAAYEHATAPSIPAAFKVIKRPASAAEGPSLADCPNEILTQILSHLHPDSHGSVALVSKRFYSLIAEPHAWRMAFLRYFPGPEAMGISAAHRDADTEEANRVRSEFRYFTRLTSLASWRSEYLLRTRLLRSVARGKPGARIGGAGGSLRPAHSSKKAGAVLTYNTKLPWMISNIHAVFDDNNKRGPKVIVGTRDLCVSTVSDPSSGKVEKWGLDDPFAFAQLDELFPNLQPFGVGDGPAAVYNVMDVSQPYGMVGGEGFPGGRPYFRATNELRGRYLGEQNNIIDMSPEVPKIPELLESICSVWIAKSSAVPSITQNMIGLMTGSTLGVVTAYALNHDFAGPQYKAGDMTARWVLSPGVPIVSLKVDDSFNQKRMSLGRVWACALNALGECFVLTQPPVPPTEARRKSSSTTKSSWTAGRTAYWELIESTRRRARPDDLDKNAVRGAYSPRSPCDAMALSKDQTIAEAREIEKYLRYEPAHFRKVCEGWDMRRQLEVDFAEEIILTILSGQDEEQSPEIIRCSRSTFGTADTSKVNTPTVLTPNVLSPTPVKSIFGSGANTPVLACSPAPEKPEPTGVQDAREWQITRLSLKKLGKAQITAVALDNSITALLAPFEDPLNTDSPHSKSGATTPISKQTTGEIPGRRARFFGIGSDYGKVLVWNVRDGSSGVVEPVFSVQTESPEVTSLAMSALYLVHGGSDGLVQAWDPLASSVEPIRTLNSRSSGRAPRHILNANPALRHADYSTCPAIFLDPDPTVLRGILCFGTFVRYWSYSSTFQGLSRRRRPRHSDIHGKLSSRRQGDAVMGYIAAEEAELRREERDSAREDARLRKRFGVGLGDLTEEEAIEYAQMVSEEAFLLDEQRRTSASDTGSAVDTGENASSFGSLDTVTPDPSMSGWSPPSGITPAAGAAKGASDLDDDDGYEQQIQRALRLSLMEDVNEVGQSPRASSSTDFEFAVRFKPTKEKRSTTVAGSASQSHKPSQWGQPWNQAGGDTSSPINVDEVDDDLALAIRLSLEEEEHRQQYQSSGLGIEEDGFPPLETSGKGKGVLRH